MLPTAREITGRFLFFTSTRRVVPNTLSRPDRRCGFVIHVSRLLPLSNEAAFLGFYDARLREKWLDARITIRKAFATSLLKCNWTDGQPTIDVHFRPVTGRETEVEIEHRKLPTKNEAIRMKAFWSGALEALEVRLVPRR